MEYAIVGTLVLIVLAVMVRTRRFPGQEYLRFVPAFVTSDRSHPAQPPAAPLATFVRDPGQVAPDGLMIKQLVWAGTLEADFGRPYPVLAAIDRARPDGTLEFARDPHAAELETLANAIIARHWSDLVWMTGMIDQTRFDLLCTTLERECRSRADAIRMVPELPDERVSA